MDMATFIFRKVACGHGRYWLAVNAGRIVPRGRNLQFIGKTCGIVQNFADTFYVSGKQWHSRSAIISQDYFPFGQFNFPQINNLPN